MSAYAITITMSPGAQSRAAGPLRQHVRVPGSAGMVYVSSRAPLFTLTTCTRSYGRMFAISISSRSRVMEPS